jgi:hypothetical protein
MRPLTLNVNLVGHIRVQSFAMIVFLSLSYSLEVVASTKAAFFPSQLVAENKSVSITFSVSVLRAILLWSSDILNSDICVTILLAARPAVTISGGHGVQITGASCTVRFNCDVRLQVWFISLDLCSGPVLMYSAPSVFTDNIRPRDPHDSVCVFVSQSPPLRFTMSPGQSNATFTAFHQSDISSGKEECASQGSTPRVCEADLGEPAFFVLRNVPADLITLHGQLEKKREDLCAREFLPLITETETSTRQIQLARRTVLSCVNDERTPSYSLSFIILVAMFVGMAVFTFVTVCGWGFKLKAKLNRFLRLEMVAKMEIDPMNMGRRNSVHDQVPLIPDHKEEEAEADGLCALPGRF